MSRAASAVRTNRVTSCAVRAFFRAEPTGRKTPRRQPFFPAGATPIPRRSGFGPGGQDRRDLPLLAQTPRPSPMRSGGASPPSTSCALWRKPMPPPGPVRSAPCRGARGCTPRIWPGGGGNVKPAFSRPRLPGSGARSPSAVGPSLEVSFGPIGISAVFAKRFLLSPMQRRIRDFASGLQGSVLTSSAVNFDFATPLSTSWFLPARRISS